MHICLYAVQIRIYKYYWKQKFFISSNCLISLVTITACLFLVVITVSCKTKLLFTESLHYSRDVVIKINFIKQRSIGFKGKNIFICSIPVYVPLFIWWQCLILFFFFIELISLSLLICICSSWCQFSVPFISHHACKQIHISIIKDGFTWYIATQTIFVVIHRAKCAICVSVNF